MHYLETLTNPESVPPKMALQRDLSHTMTICLLAAPAENVIVVLACGMIHEAHMTL